MGGRAGRGANCRLSPRSSPRSGGSRRQSAAEVIEDAAAEFPEFEDTVMESCR
ncbi:hypothetical protein [Kitasatospora griseola]